MVPAMAMIQNLPGRSAKDKMEQPTDQRMQAILASSDVSQISTRNVVQTRHFIQFPTQQQTTIGTDPETMEQEPRPSVKIEPRTTGFPSTL